MSDYIGKELRRPVYRSEMTAEKALSGNLRFDPEGHQIWDEDGNPLIHFDTEIVDARDPSRIGTIIPDNPPSIEPL